ncbi:hemolysin III ['Chrysanthemum coronarium' phytoplasma]|uniref:Hemolysin III homolog n=2 Tax=16SrI (Aster yellows group) TaxID=3042590 RepID=Q6YR58_ONYPE|nr:hemolysin III homolog [Onion yellows phytoplasma OY-M]GAK73798.1 hemolysin III ['Chrysanthemum coronarium' phytoplasma]
MIVKWATKPSDKQTLGEEIANAISHGLMIPLGVFILVCFCLKASVMSNPNGYIVLVFSISMIILYLMSTLYHSLSFTKAHNFFQKTDHISIYLLIWGTFAPILLLLPELQKPLFPQSNLLISKGKCFFVCQCILAFSGIICKVFWMNKGKIIHLIFYALLGWSGLLLVPAMWKANIFHFVLLGGVFYSLGIYFYVKDNKKYFHFIWHLFVMAGTCFHAWGIYRLLEILPNN